MTLTTQFYTMIAMIGMGSFLGAALDTYNFFLKRWDRKRWVVFLNDLVFWAVQGLLTFYVLLYVNQGELRFYVFLALLCGFAAYQSLLRNGYMACLRIMIKIAVSIYQFFVKIFLLLLINPIKWIVHMAIACSMSLLLFLWKVIKWSSQLLFKLCKILLAPLLWGLNILWGKAPQPIKQKMLHSKQIIEGIFINIKNMLRKLYRRFR
ncbi:spore cortex biosynthesis protein YabQ [Aeribacillus pallidus]|uniref:Spore cortex biosynthesis protein YabQ n=2 Tax=Aeribacillus pallidus TaxID=33936 RepID=A0A223E3B4_9BACI|nr:spore cortex biosynthesis protein YabQ [Aeribacillus pallidus]